MGGSYEMALGDGGGYGLTVNGFIYHPKLTSLTGKTGNQFILVIHSWIVAHE